MVEASEILAMEQELYRQKADLGYFIKVGDKEQVSSLIASIGSLHLALDSSRGV